MLSVIYIKLATYFPKDLGVGEGWLAILSLSAHRLVMKTGQDHNICPKVENTIRQLMKPYFWQYFFFFFILYYYYIIARF